MKNIIPVFLGALLLGACSPKPYALLAPTAKPLPRAVADPAPDLMAAADPAPALLAVPLPEPEAVETPDVAPAVITATTKRAERAERRAVRKVLRKAAWQHAADRVFAKNRTADVHVAAAPQDEVNVLALILAIFIPPLGVLVYESALNTKFWISLLLTLLFFLPGMIYSILVVLGIV